MGITTPRRDRRRKLTTETLAAVQELIAEGELTQQEIADRFGVSQSHVSRLSRQLHDVLDVLDYLGVGSAELQATHWETWHRLLTLLEIERRLRDQGAHLDD